MRITSLASQARPTWLTGMIAVVRGVIAASMSFGSMLYVRGSMSTNTGVAPANMIEFAVAMKVYDGQITSSPGFTPAAISARCSPVVALLQAMPCLAPT